MQVDVVQLVSSLCPLAAKQPSIDTLGIRIPIDFAILYQITQSTSGTESYSEGLTLIDSILHEIVSNAVSERT